jgi:hypothetical protein
MGGRLDEYGQHKPDSASPYFYIISSRQFPRKDRCYIMVPYYVDIGLGVDLWLNGLQMAT